MKLSISCGAYDRTWPLIAKHIEPEGVELDWHIMPPEEAFLRGMVYHEFDLTEMSFSTYLLQLSRGDNGYRAVPVFPSRSFRHSAIYIRADAGIEKPEDLKGRTIGLPEYQLTANVWARGLLSDEYGVRAEDVRWVHGGMDDYEVGREEKVPADLPPSIDISPIGEGETLWGMMTRGEIDAIIAPRSPRAFDAGDPRVTRLFVDVRGAEQAYFKKTGLFPIMHLLGIRNDLVEDHPELAKAIFAAFEQARLHAVTELDQVAYKYVMMPWLIENMAEIRSVMGDDYWPYGIEKNRKCLEAMCRYSHEQGLAKKLFKPEELFEAVE